MADVRGAEQRIVSLLPSATEILFAVGAGDAVVAVTHECDFPAGAAGRPRITASAINHDGSTCAAIDRHIKATLHQGSSIYRLDEALLASLAPTLVVTQELCDVCAVAYTEVAHAVRRLAADTPILSLEPTGLDEILGTITAVGRATGHGETAAQVVASLERRLGAVDRLDRPPPWPTVCIEWTDPLMVGGHWVPEMVGRAGGVDPLGIAGQPSRWVEWDDVVAARPQVMILMPCGFGLDRTVELASDVTGLPGFAELPCAVSGRVAAVDGSAYFNRPGPRIVDGLEIVAAILRTDPPRALPPGSAWVTW
ncbi:MAG: cobalamin-binding protein [Acidimicrobiales bacterium]